MLLPNPQIPLPLILKSIFVLQSKLRLPSRPGPLLGRKQRLPSAGKWQPCEIEVPSTIPFPGETTLLTKKVGTSGVYLELHTLLCNIIDTLSWLTGRYPVDMELESLMCFPLQFMTVPFLLRKTTPPLLSCIKRRRVDMPVAKN